MGHTNWYNFPQYNKLKQDNMRIRKIVVTLLKIFGKDNFSLLYVTVQEAKKQHTRFWEDPGVPDLISLFSSLSLASSFSFPLFPVILCF